MRSPTGIIPESMMYGSATSEVMKFIAALVAPGHEKADLFRGWAKTVGVKLSASQIAVVERTGNDQ